MKSMRLALAALAMVIIAGIGFALLNSSAPPSRQSAPEPQPMAAPAPKPVAPAAVAKAAPPSPVRTEAEMPVLQAPNMGLPGVNKEAELAKAKELEAEIAKQMAEKSFGEANKNRRELIRLRARAGDMTTAAPTYIEIGRSELLAGNQQAAQDAAQSAMVMASIGQKDPSVLDDVAILQAAVALQRGELPKADRQLQDARKYRLQSGGPENASVGAELTALESLLDDLQGNHESAEKGFNESLDRLVIGASSPEGATVLARTRWVFERSAEAREKELGPDAPETQRAKERLERLK